MEIINVSKLYEFIDTAERSRKYPKETASALKVALRLFETVLNEEEKKSIQILKNRFEQIYRTVFERNKTKYTTSSLEIYKKRVLKVIKEYESYGEDPSKFGNWSPRIITRRRSLKNTKTVNSDGSNDNAELTSNISLDSYIKNEIPLRSGIKATLYLPDDLKISDIGKIEAFVSYLKVIATQSEDELK